MSSSADTAFTEAVDTILSEWGEPFSAAPTELTDALQELYRAELQFPPIWPEHRRRAFVAHHADIDAAELSTQFDDLIDTVTNEFGLAYGILPHPDDATELITTARRQALEEFIDRRLNYELPDEIEDVQTENPGRGEASMTACGPTQRRRSRATLMRDLRPRRNDVLFGSRALAIRGSTRRFTSSAVTMSTMTTAPKAIPLSHDEAVATAVAASVLAGHDPSPGAMDLLDRIGRGELTSDEAVAEVIAEFSRPAE